MPHLPDCLYCRNDQRLTDLMIEVAHRRFIEQLNT